VVARKQVAENRTLKRGLFLLILALAIPAVVWGGIGRIQLPKLPPPEEYGHITLDRLIKGKGMEPVHFSHWSHRVLYSCSVCHTELGFPMQRGGVEITMEEHTTGQFCGACHDGKTAFGATDAGGEDKCKNCHGASAPPPKEKFEKLRERLPKAGFGNQIDWVKAEARKLIRPKRSLDSDSSTLSFDKDFIMIPPDPNVPTVRFSHKIHLTWMDCEICHPDIFNVKRKGTERFSKKENLKGRFCGTCHMHVAFPFDDCTRCHINVWPE